MTETVEVLLWFLGIPAGWAAVLLLVFAVEWAVWQAEGATARCQSMLANWRVNSSARWSRQEDNKVFLNWLAGRTGMSSATGAVDETLVEAQQQADIIRALVEEEVPKAVLRCVETHRLTAKVTGACHFFEIAFEPDCYQLRAGVVWLLAHTVEFLQAYPLRLDDPRLLHNSIVLRKRALPTCRRCPYIQLPVDQAPRLCPTAELVQLRGEHHASAQ